MGFAVNHSQASQGRYIPPEGAYEAVFAKAEQKTTALGKRLISFTFKIREDVLQKEQGRTFEFAMFPLNSPGPQDPEGYRLGVIQMICKCVGVPEGMHFESLAHWLATLCGQPVKVDIRHRMYNGRVQLSLDYAPSGFPKIIAAAAVDPGELPF